MSRKIEIIMIVYFFLYLGLVGYAFVEVWGEKLGWTICVFTAMIGFFLIAVRIDQYKKKIKRDSERH